MVTEPRSQPCRTALRPGSWRPFGPASAVTSASINTCITCRPVPTARASRPSRMQPAISAIATLTRSGTAEPSPAGVSIFCFWYFLVTAVPCRSGVLADAQHLPHGRGGQGTATSTSTRPGTTSAPGVEQRLLARAALGVQLGDAADDEAAGDLLGLLLRDEGGEGNLGDLGLGDPGAGGLVVDRVGVLDRGPRVLGDAGDGAFDRRVHPHGDRDIGAGLQHRGDQG